MDNLKDTFVLSNAASLSLVLVKFDIWPQDNKLRTYRSQILDFESVYGLGAGSSFKRNRVNTAEKICSFKMLLHFLGKRKI